MVLERLEKPVVLEPPVEQERPVKRVLQGQRVKLAPLVRRVLPVKRVLLVQPEPRVKRVPRELPVRLEPEPVLPVQELAPPLNERQLRHVRNKCDPNFRKRKPEDIAGLCDVVRENPNMPLKALLALVTTRFASVRATADGRAGGYGGRPWGGRAAQPRAGGVCRCRCVGYPSPMPS